MKATSYMDDSRIVHLFKAGVQANQVPSDIISLYIYGSAVKNRLRDDSDVDIAMLTKYHVDAIGRIELIASVEAVATSILMGIGIRNETSVFDLRSRHASIEIVYNIVTTGVVFYSIDEEERIRFEISAMGQYFDFIPYLKKLREARYGQYVL